MNNKTRVRMKDRLALKDELKPDGYIEKVVSFATNNRTWIKILVVFDNGHIEEFLPYKLEAIPEKIECRKDKNTNKI